MAGTDGAEKNMEVVNAEIAAWRVIMSENWTRFKAGSWNWRAEENIYHIGHNFRTETIRALPRTIAYLTYIIDLAAIAGVVWLLS